MQLLSQIQRTLQSLYRLDLGFSVVDFVVKLSEMDGANVNRPEQVLVKESDDALELALVFDDALLDEKQPLSLNRLCHFTEGVSHLVYLALAAERESQVSQLELELQAEIDKFALLMFNTTDTAPELISRLFLSFSLNESIDCQTERSRYLEANRMALGFCRYLNQRFVQTERTEPMLHELRRVYRMGGAQKLEYVNECRL